MGVGLGIRETLNQKSTLTTGATVAITLIAIGFIIHQLRSGAGPAGRGAPSSRYYSDDDGASYFEDSLNKIPPFDHKGRTAVIAYVFQCKGGKLFVGYLQRWTPKGLKILQSPAGNAAADLELNESEVSAPLAGDKGWIKASGKGGLSLMNNIKCPSGDSHDIEPVQPD